MLAYMAELSEEELGLNIKELGIKYGHEVLRSCMNLL